MTVVLVCCATLTFLSVWYMTLPLFAEVQERSSSEGDLVLQGLLDQRERCSQVLRDLELDRQTQKIQEADFQQMYSQVCDELRRIEERVASLRGE
jgi:hypothetical protein